MARFRPRCGWKLSPRIREGGCSRRSVALAAPTLVAGVVIAYRLVRNGDEVQDGNHYEGQCGQISAYPEKQRYAGFPRFCRVGCLGDVAIARMVTTSPAIPTTMGTTRGRTTDARLNPAYSPLT